MRSPCSLLRQPDAGTRDLRLLRSALAALFVSLTLCGSAPAVGGVDDDGDTYAVEARPPDRAAMPGWVGTAIGRVIASHYDFRSIEGAVAATNHDQNLSAQWNARGLKVEPIVATSDEISLGLVSYGRATSPIDAAPTVPVPGGCRSDRAIGVSGECLRRLEASRGPVVEWWENRPEGIEHGFVLAEAPPGTGPLIFDLAVAGATIAIDPSGDGADLFVDGRSPLRYAGLRAWDASERPLPAPVTGTTP